MNRLALVLLCFGCIGWVLPNMFTNSNTIQPPITYVESLDTMSLVIPPEYKAKDSIIIDNIRIRYDSAYLELKIDKICERVKPKLIQPNRPNGYNQYLLVDTFLRDAIRESLLYNISVFQKLSQFILEGTSQGKLSSLGVLANNGFGYKAYGSNSDIWDGETLWFPTYEYKNGVKVKVDEPFRSYKSMAESFRDHTLLIVTSELYKDVRGLPMDDKVAIAEFLDRSGYSTAPKGHYKRLLLSIERNFNLSTVDRFIVNNVKYHTELN